MAVMSQVDLHLLGLHQAWLALAFRAGREEFVWYCLSDSEVVQEKGKKKY